MKNNLTITLNIIYIKEKEICPTYISNISSNCGKQIIPLMIPNVAKKAGIILQGKKVSTLLRGMTSKNNDDFYCLNDLHSFIAEYDIHLTVIWVGRV